MFIALAQLFATALLAGLFAVPWFVGFVAILVWTQQIVIPAAPEGFDVLSVFKPFGRDGSQSNVRYEPTNSQV